MYLISRTQVVYFALFLLLLFVYGSIVSRLTYSETHSSQRDLNNAASGDDVALVHRTSKHFSYEFHTLKELLTLTKDYIHLFDESVIPWRKELKNPCFLSSNDAFLPATSALDTPGSQLYCLPYFFVLGYTKSGSTEFYSRISLISKVGRTNTKEAHYWDNNMNRNNNTMERYMHNLVIGDVCTRRDVIFGDFTPRSVWHSDEFDYINNVSLPFKVHSLLPRSKLIVLIRNPTDRLLSDFNYYYPAKYGDKTSERFHRRVVEAINWWNKCRSMYSLRYCVYVHHFDDSVLKPLDIVKCDNSKHMPLEKRLEYTPKELLQLDPYKDRNKYGVRPTYEGTVKCDFTFNWRSNGADRLRVGIYHVNIEEWLKYFPRNQLFAMTFDEYVENPDSAIHRAVDFLEIRDFSSKPEGRMRKNASGSKVKMLNETRHILNEFYRPFNEKLAALLGDDRFLWK